MNYYQKFYIDFEESFYMYIPLGIILSSCIGSAAAMLALMQGHGFTEMLQLLIVTVACMGFNSTVLANLKPKVVFHALLLSLLVNISIIIYHLIA
ncbi:hypothetical protein [Mesonia sp. K7]|uniref:hypothetical protein n=1 Tax=Mesonia sp. K7 TaxID=2218606 RepID=UPI000DAA7ACD|nr:hypothetical protein [Mesonia sp. K7]PZD76695.1 hypothetical protein DNG35_11095 [Mesonia sp. K7]